jgi:OOP family OmpA-OmpF porin
MNKVLLNCVATGMLSLICGSLTAATAAPHVGEGSDNVLPALDRAAGSPQHVLRVNALVENFGATHSNASAIAVHVAQATGNTGAGSIVTFGPQVYSWSATKTADGKVQIDGVVPDRATQQYLAVRLAGDLVDETSIDPKAPATFGRNLLVALDLLDLLDEGAVTFDGNAWAVTGVTSSPEIAQDLITEAGMSWEAALSDTPAPTLAAPVATPAEPAAIAPPIEETAPATEEPVPPAHPVATQPPAVDPPAQPAVSGAAALALCRTQVAELSAHNAILFQSGAAIIAETAATELDAFAAALARCEKAFVYVEGHTDSDGDAQKNLALSVARAEAVVNALVARGIAPERLYAIGYGESKPVADNATRDGKSQNRRIVVTVDDVAR